MKENKELIQEIVNQLKESHDLPYKEGSWEKFKSYDNSPIGVLVFVRKYASVAAVLLISLGFIYYNIESGDSIRDSDLNTNSTALLPVQKNENNGQEKRLLSVSGNDVIQGVESKVIDLNDVVEAERRQVIVPMEDEMLNKIELAELVIDNKLHEIVLPTRVNLNLEDQNTILRNRLKSANLVLARNVYENNSSNSIVSPQLFKFTDRFELGLFISPFTNSDNLRIGTGITLTYNLSDKINIRTGASYNTYEVGVLKNPLDDNSIEQVYTKVDNSVLQGPSLDGGVQSISRVTIPNIDAVTGFVQSVEFPLEVKYNLANSLYAVAGLSYSMIINQERNAHYMENNNSKIDFVANTLEAIVPAKSERKTVKSAIDNVNPSAYSGFVNLSVGKKVNINQKFKMSIEPYYKIPVGGFRASDMNYNNAGVRLMTSF